MDEHIQRADEYLKQLQDKVEKARSARDRKVKNGRVRSEEEWETQHQAKARKFAQDHQRFTEWKEQHAQYLRDVVEQARARICVERNANGVKSARDIERSQKILADMEATRKRFEQQCEKLEADLKARWSQKGKLICQRAQTAKQTKESIVQEAVEKNRQAVEKNWTAFEQRYAVLLAADELEREGRKVERDERAQNAKHQLSAVEYADLLKAKQMKEDFSAAAKLALEGEAVKKEKSGARLRCAQARKRLEQELAALEGIDDEKGLAEVKKLLHINDLQLAELVAAARAPTGQVPMQRGAKHDGV
jgi:hypothetical protein